jgi:hypothetical protein
VPSIPSNHIDLEKSKEILKWSVFETNRTAHKLLRSTEMFGVSILKNLMTSEPEMAKNTDVLNRWPHVGSDFEAA